MWLYCAEQTSSQANSVCKMELVQMFDNCMKRNTTVKQELQWIGLSRKALKKESLKELKEETVFAGMMNWIIN